jgi:hypothetical protein
MLYVQKDTVGIGSFGGGGSKNGDPNREMSALCTLDCLDRVAEGLGHRQPEAVPVDIADWTDSCGSGCTVSSVISVPDGVQSFGLQVEVKLRHTAIGGQAAANQYHAPPPIIQGQK